jgi:Ca-activated chloride channel family protein
MTLGFEYPLLILAGVAAILLLILCSRFFKDAFTLIIPLGPPGGIAFKPPRKLKFLLRFLYTLELGGVLLLFIAAAGPVFIYTNTVWLGRGADIMFVIDVSPSMAALDMGNQNRFSVAKALVHDFAKNRPSDAIGLAAVGKDAALLLPPTVDRGILFSRLDSLNIGELGDGTALGMGLAIATLHLKDSGASRKAVVLLTDGENNAGAIHPGTAAALLPEIGASLWVIAIGTGGEVPIDYVDPVTKTRHFGAFDSRFDPENLKAIAEKGEGTFIPAPSAEALDAAFSRINETEVSIGQAGTITRTRNIQTPFTITALILLCLVRFIRRHTLGALL